MSFVVMLDFDGTSDDRGDPPGLHSAVRNALKRLAHCGWRWVLNSDRNRDDLLRVVSPLSRALRPAAVVAQSRAIEVLDERGNYRPHEGWNDAGASAHSALWRRLAPHLDAWIQEVHATFRVRLDLCADDALAFVVHPEEVRSLRTRLQTWVEGIPGATVSSNHESCFVVHRSFCKGRASREAARLLNVKRTQVRAIGDGMNDLPMLRESATVGCPANACPEVRRHVLSRKCGLVADLDGAHGTAEVLDAWLSSFESASTATRLRRSDSTR